LSERETSPGRARKHFRFGRTKWKVREKRDKDRFFRCGKHAQRDSLVLASRIGEYFWHSRGVNEDNLSRKGKQHPGGASFIFDGGRGS